MANLPQLKICKNHKAIHFFSSRTGRNFDWDFVVDDLIKSVSVRGRVSVNDGDAYIDLALQGFGIIQGPRYMLTNHLESGLLKRGIASVDASADADFSSLSSKSSFIA